MPLPWRLWGSGSYFLGSAGGTYGWTSKLIFKNGIINFLKSVAQVMLKFWQGTWQEKPCLFFLVF